MAKFSLSNTMAGTPQAIAAAYKTLWDITAATGATTLRRAFIYHVQFGAADAPAASDGPIVWKIDRQTTLGTRTAATPAPLDVQDAAALITAGVNATVEPTVTSATQLLEIPLNQRSTYQWIAKDGGEDRKSTRL